MLQSIKKLRREITNLIVQLTPWEMRIKKIESKSRTEWNVLFLRCTFRDNVFNVETKILLVTIQANLDRLLLPISRSFAGYFGSTRSLVFSFVFSSWFLR